MSGYSSSQYSCVLQEVSLMRSDKIQKVDHIDCKQSGLLEHGLCEVELFVSSQSSATDDVDWGICSVEDGHKV
jgi:hypothetical protein